LSLKALAVFQDFFSHPQRTAVCCASRNPQKTGFQFNELEYPQLFLVFCVEKGSKEYS
jgi:hypothetical protein